MSVDTGEAKKTQATLLVTQAMGTPGSELFHSPEGDTFASVVVNRHREIYPIKSSAFAAHLRRLFFQTFAKAPSASVVKDALNMAEAIAVDSASPVHPVSLRVGEDDDGALWLDLCDAAWLAVRITPEGWRIVENPNVRFRRAPGALPLPLPAEGGSTPYEILRPFLNFASEDDYCLALSWLASAYRPCGPYSILALHGEQGTAKSTVSRTLRCLIDPYKAPLRTAPRNEEDLQIAAANSHIVAYDNISKLESWLSDALCRLATGGGMSVRTLFTNTEETVFDAMRPLLLNGIPDVGTKGDFAERSVILYLPQIPPEKRMREKDYWSNFRKVEPYILGALLTAISGGLRDRDCVRLLHAPRMSDFAHWAVAMEKPLGFKSGTFLRAYAANSTEATSIVLDDVVAQAILRFARNQKDWVGSASELLREVLNSLTEYEKAEKSLPKSPIAFSNLCKRLAPGLRTMGADLKFGRREPGTGRRLIEVVYRETTAEAR